MADKHLVAKMLTKEQPSLFAKSNPRNCGCLLIIQFLWDRFTVFFDMNDRLNFSFFLFFVFFHTRPVFFSCWPLCFVGMGDPPGIFSQLWILNKTGDPGRYSILIVNLSRVGISHMLHGAGIFTYKTGPFLG